MGVTYLAVRKDMGVTYLVVRKDMGATYLAVRKDMGDNIPGGEEGHGGQHTWQ